VVREIAIGDAITVADLAQKLALKGGDVVKALFKMGVMATITQTIDHDTAVLVTEELGHKAVHGRARRWSPSWATSTTARPRCWTTSAAQGGGGRSRRHHPAHRRLPRETPRGMITFLDTPGHEAFTAMRARGAKATDIVILVVAADDGVMPQTKEAIKHAKAAGVPIVVAINKIDKPDANPSASSRSWWPKRWCPKSSAATSPFVPVSAKTGQGIDELLEQVLLQAEVLELKAPVDAGQGPGDRSQARQGPRPGGHGAGAVRHAEEGRRGAAASSTAACAPCSTKTASRCQAGPSIPVEIQGLSEVPQAGDDFMVLADERRAQRDRRRGRHHRVRRQQLAATSKATVIGFNVRADASARRVIEATASTCATSRSSTTSSTR
jgi:translation initiation factor IF-2